MGDNRDEMKWVRLLEAPEPKLSKIMEMLGRQGIIYRPKLENYRLPSIWVKPDDLRSAQHLLRHLECIPDHHPIWDDRKSTWKLYLMLEGIASLCRHYSVDSLYLRDVLEIRGVAKRLNGPLHSALDSMGSEEEDKLRVKIEEVTHELISVLLESKENLKRMF